MCWNLCERNELEKVMSLKFIEFLFNVDEEFFKVICFLVKIEIVVDIEVRIFILDLVEIVSSDNSG